MTTVAQPAPAAEPAVVPTILVSERTARALLVALVELSQAAGLTEAQIAAKRELKAALGVGR